LDRLFPFFLKKFLGVEMKKWSIVALLIGCGMLISLPVGAKDLKDMIFGKVPYTMGHAYHQAHVKHMINYAKAKYGIEVRVIDGETTNDASLAGVETFIGQGVDGVIVHINDPVVMDQAARIGLKAGIPVTSFYQNTKSKIVPHTQINEARTSKLMGIAAALKWKEWYPNKPIKIGVIDFLEFEIVQSGRTRPFIAGVMEFDPTAELILKLEGGGSAEKAMNQTRDMMQAHPEINIIYGATADHALGIAAALEAMGRGKAINGKCLTEIVVGTDATEAELIKVYDPSSAFKITQGLQPSVNAAAEIDLMVKIKKGEIKMDEYYQVDTYNKLVTYWTTTVEQAQKFVSYEYFSNFDLKSKIK
jgi:ABC-type sugar transport system substrate-binding protein